MQVMPSGACVKKKLFYFIISNLPEFFRHKIYRKLYARVPVKDPEGMVFELARSQEDLETAFKLLHDVYVDQGFITPRVSGMHLIVAHALPTTSILVTKVDGKVIGTISVMRDTPLGLPMEKVFDISSLRRGGCRVAEFSCLAIDPNFRRSRGAEVFFPLTLYAAIFARNYFGVDYLVFNLYPHHADFYNAIFGSTHLLNNKVSAKDYLGAPATGIKLDLKNVEKFAFEKYSSQKEEKNLYHYTFVKNHSYFKFPDSTFRVINYPVMSPKNLKYFFAQKTTIFESLSLLERQVLKKYFPNETYQSLFGREDTPTHLIRKDPRWDVRIEGEFLTQLENKRVIVKLIDISHSGFRAHLSLPLSGKVHSFGVITMDGQLAKIKAQVVWKKSDGTYGFFILESNEVWSLLVKSQGQELSRLAS